MEITFDVLGRPAPQGSKRSVGGGRFIEASKFLPTWRTDLKIAATEAAASNEWTVVDGPVELEVIFYLDRPSSISKTARPYPVVPPDLDKLVRAVGDALTGVIYRDDSQIIRLLAWKQYADTREPGAFIRVAELSRFDNEEFISLDFLDF